MCLRSCCRAVETTVKMIKTCMPCCNIIIYLLLLGMYVLGIRRYSTCTHILSCTQCTLCVLTIHTALYTYVRISIQYFTMYVCSNALYKLHFTYIRTVNTALYVHIYTVPYTHVSYIHTYVCILYHTVKCILLVSVYQMYTFSTCAQVYTTST